MTRQWRHSKQSGEMEKLEKKEQARILRLRTNIFKVF
jgi:hypothetical protein